MRRSHVLEVACGGAHTLVLTSSREVFSWGSGFFGQLGHGDGKDSAEPRRLHEMHGLDIKQLQAGENHSAALTSFGEVYSWGRGEFGVLGHGDSRSRKTPAAVAALKSASTCVSELVSGSDHMFGITYAHWQLRRALAHSCVVTLGADTATKCTAGAVTCALCRLCKQHH